MRWLISLETLLTYGAAAAVLVLLPGPAQALVLTRSLERGARAGIITAVGLDSATLVHTLFAALGISAILAASAAVFASIKLAGALYLIWLGVRMLRSTSSRAKAARAATTTPAVARPISDSALLLQGFLTGLLNPKVALFFLAFLPQFVRQERGHVLLQFLVLGGIFAVFDLVWVVCLALAAARARSRLGLERRWALWRERFTGAMLIALGLKLALARR